MLIDRLRVSIDGRETVLTFDRFSEARGYQYLTPDRAASHAFQLPLKVGTAFYTNGHHYKVLGVAS